MTVQSDKRGDLIGIGGRLGAGKDAVADYLVEKHGWVKLNMSDPLVKAARVLDPLVIVPDDLDDFSDLPDGTIWRFSKLLDAWGYVEAKTVPEVRRILQTLGTEVGRNMIDPNVWVDIADTEIFNLRAAGKDVVITGIRFQEELDMIRENRGDTWWVSRPSAELAESAHASEMSLAFQNFETVLRNEGTLDDLYAEVDRVLTTL